MTRVYIYLILFLLTDALSAQHQVGLDLDLGKIIKHKEELLYETPSLSYGLRLDHRYDFGGNNPSINYWGNPKLYSSLGIFSFGDEEVLGYASYVMSGLDWRLGRLSNFEVNVTFQSGLAYINRTYDRADNPTNNAIGSHLNNASKLGVNLSYQPSPTLDIYLSTSILHFSNGLNVSPNSGINALIFSAGVTKVVGSKSLDISSQALDVDRNSQNKHGFAIHSAIGKKQNAKNFGGPSHGVFYYRLDYIYKRNPFHGLALGISHEYDGAKYQFEKDVFTPEQDARDKAYRSAIAFSNELLLGRFTSRQTLGFYTPFPFSRGDDPFYIILSTDYKLFSLAKIGSSLHIGVQLKTHFSVADYISYFAQLRF